MAVRITLIVMLDPLNIQRWYLSGDAMHWQKMKMLFICMPFALFMLVCSDYISNPGIPEDEAEDIGAALWDTSGLDEPIWQSVGPTALANVSNISAWFREWDDNATTLSEPMLLDSVDSSIVDLGFKQEIVNMNEQIDSFLSNFVPDKNNTADWTFVTFITLVPLRCSVVNSIVAQFDDAMGQANPAAGITSVARRLGAMPCDNSVCPCVDDSRRRYTTRVMEVHSHSRSQHVEFPKAFPYRVDIRPAERR